MPIPGRGTALTPAQLSHTLSCGDRERGGVTTTTILLLLLQLLQSLLLLMINSAGTTSLLREWADFTWGD